MSGHCSRDDARQARRVDDRTDALEEIAQRRLLAGERLAVRHDRMQPASVRVAEAATQILFDGDRECRWRARGRGDRSSGLDRDTRCARRAAPAGQACHRRVIAPRRGRERDGQDEDLIRATVQKSSRLSFVSAFFHASLNSR